MYVCCVFLCVSAGAHVDVRGQISGTGSLQTVCNPEINSGLFLRHVILLISLALQCYYS